VTVRREQPRSNTLDVARDAAIRRLAEQCERYPDLVPGGPETEGLSVRDAAFAHAIYDAAVRRLITLAAVLRPFVRQPFEDMEPAMQAVLLAGATQMLFLDRVPAHAVLNESVDWAKQRIRDGAGGMVNAVLRRISEIRAEATVIPGGWSGAASEIPRSDGTSLRFSRPIFEGDEIEVLRGATSHPRELLDRWRANFGNDTARVIALHDVAEPPITLNVAYAKNASTDIEPPTTAHADEGSAVFTGTRRELMELMERRRDVWVQDSSSARSVALAKGLEPQVVLDACAGQGTKTRQLAAQFPGATILATDQDRERMRALREATRHLGNVRVIEPYSLRDHQSTVDLLVLDVPCSNTGVLARRPEARYRAEGTQLARLAGVQRDIILATLSLLRAQGHVLYCTCSLEPEENEAQAAFVGSRGFEEVRGHRILPTGLPGDAPGGYRDGAFATLLRSVG
jgi:16S rRNA (cytosine967-C5)-methyltransferase